MTAMTAPPLKSGHRFALDATAGRLTPAERAERGRAARAAVPRASHAVYDPPADRPDPVGLLERQAASRVPDLVPVRYGRMLARAHARSGDRIAIAAYLGRSAVFDQAIAEFAAIYADQNERDHQALAAAASSGRITAQREW